MVTETPRPSPSKGLAGRLRVSPALLLGALLGSAVTLLATSTQLSETWARPHVRGRNVVRLGQGLLWAPFASREPAGDRLVPGLHVPAMCGAHAAPRQLGDDEWELGAVYDCVCNPQLPRPRHCRFLVVQSGDYELERGYGTLAQMPYFTASRIAMQLYAAAHGYSYLYVDLRGRSVGADRAAAWMKLPLLRAASQYFDHVFMVDPDIGPGANFTTPLRWVADHLPRGSGKSFVFAGNAPSPPGGPCTGAMLVKSGVGDDTARLLEYWWSLADTSDEFLPFKTKHVWEQQVIDRLVRRKKEFASNVSVVMHPKLMGNPESSFMQHFWSDGTASGADRHAKVQRGLLEALAHSLDACGAEPHCSTLIARIASWRHYLPVVKWDDLYPGALCREFWFGSVATAAATCKSS